MTNETKTGGKLRAALAQIPHLPRTLRLLRQAAPRLTTVWALLLLVQGLLPVATVYLTRALVDDLVLAMGAGGDWENLRPVLILVGTMAGILLLQMIIRSVVAYVSTIQAERVQDHVRRLIHERSIAADLGFYETPGYYDHLHRAREESRQRPAALLASTGSLLQNGITLIAMGAVLLRFGFLMPTALLVSTVPALLVVLGVSVRLHEWRRSRTEEERRAIYYDQLLTVRETAPEIRLFDLGPHYLDEYQDLRARLRGERAELASRQSRAEIMAGIFALLVTGTALALMVWRAGRGLLTLGELAMFYQAFHQGQRLLRSLLENVGQVYRNMLFLGNLYEFLDLEPAIRDADRPADPAPLADGIRFEGVTFTYPGARRPVLSEFDLTVPAGKIVAVVGPNGSGKSTIIRLLCRLYDPEQGRITLDGTDLKDFALEKLREQFSVLLQDPVRYHATFRENITMGALDADPDEAAITAAARASGAGEVAEKLPNGADTLLGRWFPGGTELSVGEWQRLALARAFFRCAPVLLLDEPTSAMDSWAEQIWIGRFRYLTKGRTSILITHRFTTAMHADLIYVLKETGITESGTHGELIAAGGEYARSWNTQVGGSPEGG